MLSGVILFGCSDRDSNKTIEGLIPNMNLSPEILDQTVWKGEVVGYYEGKESYRYQINLFFRAGKNVTCYVINGKDEEQLYDIGFKANGRLLSISSDMILSGDWLLTDTIKDKIVLKNNAMNDKNMAIMTLTRIYKANNKLPPELLDQTIWKGSFVSYVNNRVEFTNQISLFFRSGEVVFLIDRVGGFQSRGTRPYVVDKGMLSISWTWTSPQLSGDWLAFEVSKDKLILQKGYGNDNENYIMTLTRTN
jgi:hypothetical protein